MTDYLPYAKPSIDESDRQAALEALAHHQLTRGPKTEAFEHAIAEYCDARHAVAFSSGTAALHAAYSAVDLSPADRVITSANTYVGTVVGALHRGARIELLDIDANTGNLDADQLKHFQPSSRGRQVIVPVHYRGAPLDMRQLATCISDPRAVVIEDGAQALGASYPSGGRVGNGRWSDMTVFSLHPAKSVTTAEGGIVTTNDEHRAARLRQFRNNGIHREPSWATEKPWYYEVRQPSGNFHLTEMQAALGLSQLKRLDDFVDKRRSLVAYYRSMLDIPHVTPLEGESDPISGHHLFVVRIDFTATKKSRAEVMLALRERGVGTQVHYIPLYRQPILKREANHPQMETFYAEALTLPLYYDLEETDVDRVVRELRAALV